MKSGLLGRTVGTGRFGTVIHEVVKFGLVFSLAKALQEAFKVALLLFQTAQCVLFVGVKGAVAGGGHRMTRPATAAAAA